MKKFNVIKVIAACAVLQSAAPALSHIALETKTAAAGSNYKAVLQVRHGCAGSPTTAVSVQIPAGFEGVKPYPKAGWALTTPLGKLAPSHRKRGTRMTEDVTEVRWTAASKEAALQEAQVDTFQLGGKLPATVGPIWFKVVQTCEAGRIAWTEVPASGTSTQNLKYPAALLEVVTVAQAATAVVVPMRAVQVAGAWVRATVPGQLGSGAFMQITAKTALRLVGVSSPVAGVAEVHEMKMDGDVMQMRPLTAGLDLPAGKTVELKASGQHVMLMDLRQTLTVGSTVAMTLRFEDAKGATSQLDVQLPVAQSAPRAAAVGHQSDTGMDNAAHKH